MRPIQYVLLWIGAAFLYAVTLVLLLTFMPEVEFYGLIRKFTGVISGDVWDKYYFLSICLASLLIVSIVVYITALIKKR
jgi:cellulose synthase/poly-beta-1,6-N-acetylglucosamine synthase-like glycosyltransferase